jgi:hypothetical protein
MEIGEEERPRAAVSACLVRHIRLRKARSDDERTPKASVRKLLKRDFPAIEKRIRSAAATTASEA